MKITRGASAIWQGSFPSGNGNISTESGALRSSPYGVGSRFEGRRGTNPEELIAAAHASCFAMACALAFTEARFSPQQLFVSADVTLEQMHGDFSITHVHLVLQADVPGIDEASFLQLTEAAKTNCPVSKLLSAQITLDASLTAPTTA